MGAAHHTREYLVCASNKHTQNTSYHIIGDCVSHQKLIVHEYRESPILHLLRGNWLVILPILALSVADTRRCGVILVVHCS